METNSERPEARFPNIASKSGLKHRDRSPLLPGPSWAMPGVRLMALRALPCCRSSPNPPPLVLVRVQRRSGKGFRGSLGGQA